MSKATTSLAQTRPSRGGALGGGGGLLARVFLPRGLEADAEYLAFQAADSVQALCSYLRGTLTMHATLTGAGLGGGPGGPAGAAALSAVATFVLKDGAGMLAGLAFASAASAAFDGETRFWRLFADVANDVGLTLELAAPAAGGLFLPLTLAANAAKALCGVAAGATRTATSAHFAAAAGNVGEVAAKEGVQETAVTLAGMALGYALVRALAGGGGGGGAGGGEPRAPVSLSSTAAAWAAFGALTAVHVAANYVGMRVLVLRTLNRGRALAVRDAFGAGGGPAAAARVPTPAALAPADPLLLPRPYAAAAARAAAACACRARAPRAPPLEPTVALGARAAAVEAAAREAAAAAGAPAAAWRDFCVVARRAGPAPDDAWRVETLADAEAAAGAGVDGGVGAGAAAGAGEDEDEGDGEGARRAAGPAGSARRRRGSAAAPSAAAAASPSTPSRRSAAGRSSRAGTAAAAAAAAGVDGFVVAAAPAAPAGAGAWRLPALLTRARIAPAVRVALLDGARPDTLFAAYCVGASVLAGPRVAAALAGGARSPAAAALLRDVRAELAAAAGALAAARRAGWTAVELGDEGFRHALVAGAADAEAR